MATLAAGASEAVGQEGEIVACQKRVSGFLRVVRSASACRRGSAWCGGTSRWACRAGRGQRAAGPRARRCRQGTQGPPGAAGPAGPAGPQVQPARPERRALPGRRVPGPRGRRDPRVALAALDGTACTQFDGSAGSLDVATIASGVVELRCTGDAAAPPPPPPPGDVDVVINEVDYDQVGTDADGFVELKNVGTPPRSLDGLALVLVNGGDGAEYDRVALTGSLAAGAYLLVPAEMQNGAPDGVALIDTATKALLDALSYEGEISAATIDGQVYDLVEGTPLPATVADSNSVDGSLSRLPDGADTNDAATDWAFTTTKTPGAANAATS